MGLATFSTRGGREICRIRARRPRRYVREFWGGCVCRRLMASTIKRERAKRTLTSCLGFRGIMVRPSFEFNNSQSHTIVFCYFSGRTTAGDPSTFASVTELQYDRLVKWSKGSFSKSPMPPPPPPTRIEDLPLQDQPGALTKASLEATIGAPLYPGIEMSWNAELCETYRLDVPFTICDDLLPGDLTKYLSLPWQSDFYMCRSYW